MARVEREQRRTNASDNQRPMATTSNTLSAGGFENTGALSARDHSRLPEYTRVPPVGGRCPITGLARSSILKVIYPCAANNHRPPVRSFALKKKGGFRGARLISVPSLIAYIESHGASGKDAA